MGGLLYQNGLWIVVGLLATLALGLGVWGLTRRRRSPSSTQANGKATAQSLSSLMAENWPVWQTSIRNALMQYGWADEYFMSSVPAPLWVPAMRRYVDEHPEEGLVFYDDPPRIELINRLRLKTFLHSWKAAWELVESEETFHSVVTDIAAQICDILGFVQVPQEQRIYRHLHGFVVRTPALRLKLPPSFPIVFIRRREGAAEDLTDLRSLMSILSMTSYFALLIDLNDFAHRLDPHKNLRHLVRDSIHDFIVLDGMDLRQLIIARDPGRRLVDMILQQVDLTVVSPYVTSGPVPESMFFGRDHELKTITRRINDTSFALIGGRRIGKTSILAKVYRLLSDSRPPGSTLYLDCQSVNSYREFFEAANTIWGAQPPIHSPEDFRRYVVVQKQGSVIEPIIVLLDEVDGLLSYDLERGETLFSLFRALSQERHCLFVFCGERVLHNQLHAADSPLFNFCDPIHLGYLRRSAARRIILEPMEMMGVTIQDQEAVVQQITALSSCHPNLVQYLCQQLIREANDRHARLITPSDLQKVRHSSSFQEYFLEVTWGNTSALEQCITLLIADRQNVSQSEIQDILAQNGFRVAQPELQAAISGLRLYNILIKEGQRYRFASSAFSEIVHESQEIDILLSSLRSQVSIQSAGTMGGR